MQLKVLGIGSPFADDQIGWRVVECLKRSASFQRLADSGCAALALDRPGANLIHHFDNTQGVIIIDGLADRHYPGKIHRLQLENIHAYVSLSSSHGFGVAESLRLARQLNSLPHKLILYGIEGQYFLPDQTLSEPLLRVIPKLTKRIECILTAWQRNMILPATSVEPRGSL